MKFIQLMRLVIALLPLIRDAVVVAEQMFGGAGKGAEKLAFVRGTIEVVYRRAADTMDDFDELWPALEEQIALIVRTFNTLGVFRKGNSPDEGTSTEG